MASNASKDAARIQGQSADRAQAFNERVYGDQKQLMSPYVQAGNDSLARLMAQHWGTPLPNGMQQTGGSSAMLGNTARGFIPQQGPFSPPQRPLSALMAGPGPQPMDERGGNPSSLAAMQGGGAPMPQGGDDMVPMVAPDGSRNMVPRANVQMALQRGAKVAQ